MSVLAALVASLLPLQGTPSPDIPADPLPALLVGSKAPPLQVERWIKGEPVSTFQNGKVYLVELWATWCRPCIAGMTHLSDLQRRHRNAGLVVIGLTAHDEYGNNLAAVEQFVAQNPDLTDYRIAWDARSDKALEKVFQGKSFWAYYGGANAMAIPTSFLVDRQGRIAYIGLPTLIDETLERVLSGDFDLETAGATYREGKPYERRLIDYEKLMDAGKCDEAYAMARKLLAGPWKLQYRIQWFVADRIVSPDRKTAKPDLELARQCAEAAVRASGERDHAMLLTLARVLRNQGDLPKARERMALAAKLAPADQKSAILKEMDSSASPGTRSR